MRDRMLHDALENLAVDAADLLTERLQNGEEIPFEVGETSRPEPGHGTTLFAYRPLTEEFVASHADRIRELPTFENAANQLLRTHGTIAYLRLRSEPVLDVGELTHARLGVLAFLSALWEDAEHFELSDERFMKAYSTLESVVLAERLVTTVFIPVYGVKLVCEPVNLGAGVELMAAEDLDAECHERFSDATEPADCYCAISVDAPSNAPAPMPAARLQASHLLTTLRMFKPGSVALALTAHANVGGAWQQVSLPFSGRSREDAWQLLPGEDDELRQFMSAVRRIERRTRIAWALKRFEMGLERSVPAEGLTDFLAALRALLEAHDDSGRAALPARLAALCAQGDQRGEVRAIAEAAFALERLALDGRVGRADRKRLAKRAPLEVIAETERCLRALLHDLVCGYLNTDLKKLADEILMADGEPTAPQTAEHDPVYLEPVPDPASAAAPDPMATQEFDVVFDDTMEITAVDLRSDPADSEVDGHQVIDFPVESIEPAEPSETVEPGDNVWTLRPAAEVRPLPELTSDAEARKLAEDLVDRFDHALVNSFDDPPARPDEVDQEVQLNDLDPSEQRIAGLFEPIPTFEPLAPEQKLRGESERNDVRERERRTESDAMVAKTDSADPVTATDGFTFDFKVVDPPSRQLVSGSASAEDRQPDASANTAGSGVTGEPDDPSFPVPEFEPPAGPGQASAAVDEIVHASEQRKDFSAIMDRNFTPPPRDHNERPTTPFARELHGPPASAPTPAMRAAAPHLKVVSEPERPTAAAEPAGDQIPITPEQPTSAPPEQSASAPPEQSASAPPEQSASAPPEQSASAPPEQPPAITASSEELRTYSIGPATIEFRPIVDPDKDDPDDFAGAC